MFYTKKFIFENPIHPWETLKELLDEYRITQKELSERTWISEKHISGIIQWKNNISPEFALKLEFVFKISASFWNNLQTSYNEDMSRISEKNNLEKECETLKDYPYLILKKMWFVENTKISFEKVYSLRKFFSVSSLFQIPEISNNAFAFRKYDKSNFKSENFQSWLRIGEIIWDKIEVSDFSKTKLKNILPTLKELTKKDNIDIKEIENIFAEVGIYFVLVESFTNNPVVWLTRKYKQNPMIQMSDRWKKNDIFWFTLFHEIWHILLHYSPENYIFIDYKEKESSKMEQEADDFAQDFLIDKEFYQKEIMKNIIDIQKIADISQTSKSIVAWRICHDLWDKNIWRIASPYRTSINLVNLQY